MKCAADFRKIAREALSGRWKIAVLAGFIAVLLGALPSDGPEIQLNVEDGNAKVAFEVAGQQISSMTSEMTPEIGALITGSATVITIAVILSTIGFFVLGSIINAGYSKFNLELVDGKKETEINTLFGYFPYWKTLIAANLRQIIYIFLWSLLFIIPGIIAGYSYAMTGYILAENPELSSKEAIERSKQMMEGNRFRLFCLELSFIGWSILCIFTLGIGDLWLTPYMQAALAAFYRDVSGTEYKTETPLQETFERNL